MPDSMPSNWNILRMNEDSDPQWLAPRLGPQSGVFFSSGHGASMFSETWSKQHNGYICVYIYIYIYTYMEIRFHSFLGRLWDTTRNNQTQIQSTYDLCRCVGLRLGDEPQPDWWELCYGKSPCLGRSLNYKCAITRVWPKKMHQERFGTCPKWQSQDYIFKVRLRLCRSTTGSRPKIRINRPGAVSGEISSMQDSETNGGRTVL